MKKINYPLILGLLILIIMLAIMINPKMFTKGNPYSIQRITYWMEDGKLQFESPPFPPSKEWIFGSDQLGRDIYSLIIYGTRLTITLGILITVGRFILAIPIGIFAGFGSYASKSLINTFNIISNAIPALLLSYFILQMSFFQQLYLQQSMLSFIIVLTLVGWSKLALIVSERVEEILTRPFIKGEIAIGKNRLQIGLKNVIPHLAAELIVLFFLEIARALAIIMQLSFFAIFIGNLRFIEDTSASGIKTFDTSFVPEWSSMIASNKNYIRAASWSILFPSFAFFLSIFGFNMFGEGLRKIIQRKDSKVIYNLRKYKVRILTTTLGIIAVTILFTNTVFSNDKLFDFNYNNMSNMIESDFEEVLFGSENAKQLSYEISDSFKKLGLKPLIDNDYIIEYEALSGFKPKETALSLFKDGNIINSFEFGEEYTLYDINDIDIEAEIFDATGVDLYNEENYTQFKDKFILIDTSIYPRSKYFFINNIINNGKAKGLICITDDDIPTYNNNSFNESTVIYVTKQTGEVIKTNIDDGTLKIKSSSEVYSNKGRNIVGILPGEDVKIGEEATVIGFDYNFDMNDDIKKEKVLFGLELIDKLINQDINRSRTLIFVFYDGSTCDLYDGLINYSKEPLYSLSKLVAAIDMSNIKHVKASKLLLNPELTPITRYYAFGFYNIFSDYAQSKKLHLETYNKNTTHNMRYVKDLSIPVFSVETYKEKLEENNNIDLNNIGEMIFKTILNNNY